MNKLDKIVIKINEDIAEDLNNLLTTLNNIKSDRSIPAFKLGEIKK